MDTTRNVSESHRDRHCWERICPKCGGRLELLRKLPPKWNWTGMEVGNRTWKCCSCSYLEPAGQ